MPETTTGHECEPSAGGGATATTDDDVPAADDRDDETDLDGIEMERFPLLSNDAAVAAHCAATAGVYSKEAVGTWRRPHVAVLLLAGLCVGFLLGMFAEHSRGNDGKAGLRHDVVGAAGGRESNSDDKGNQPSVGGDAPVAPLPVWNDAAVASEFSGACFLRKSVVLGKCTTSPAMNTYIHTMISHGTGQW